jgi:uncharacterized membrane protein
MPASALFSSAGRGAALLVYGLYLLSIPSAGIFALAGVILAYVARGEAEGAARAHIDRQIGIWWTAFWLGAAILIIGALGAMLTVVLIGIPIVFVAWLAWFVVMAWFTIASALGLLTLLRAQP